MKKILLLLGGAGVLAAWYLGKTKNALENIIADLKDIAIDSSKTNLTQTSLLLKFSLINPTSHAVPINSFVGTLEYGGTNISAINSTNPATLTPSGTTTLTLRTTFSNLKALGLVFNLFTAKKRDSLRVKGVLTAGGINIPIDKELPITL